MSLALTSNKPLPGTITQATEEIGGHVGNTRVISQLTITTSIIGNVEIASGGILIINGMLKGKLIVQGKAQVVGKVIGDVQILLGGELILDKGGQIEGDLVNYGYYSLNGTHNGEIGILKSTSSTYITGRGYIDLLLEKGAKMEVTNMAHVQRSNKKIGGALKNEGSMTISGHSLENSLTSTGTVTITGSAIFK